ncbi:hypothetical protein C8N29_11142 [Agitococcus lubricus]|uniref:Uncharacterized protein n=1 Tax=Agitococcus lubricus TaxID=1077255 RepID=A0A2T5IX46_9GAMM|nr:hypothetical protein C8N29_11142 [Agitococcus lubricus]
MRFVHEVIDWNRYSNEQKQVIWYRLDEHLHIILPQFVRIYDPRKIFQSIERYQIPQKSRDLWRCVYNLIRFQDKCRIDFKECGFSLKEGASLVAIDQQLHQLSMAYYERSFVRAQYFHITHQE